MSTSTTRTAPASPADRAGDLGVPKVLASHARRLDALLRVIGAVVSGELAPEQALEQLSAAVETVVPHDCIDIAWVEDGSQRLVLADADRRPRGRAPR